MKVRTTLAILAVATSMGSCASRQHAGVQKNEGNSVVWTEAMLSKFDMPGRMLVDSIRNGKLDGESRVGAIVTLNGDTDADALRRAGFSVSEVSGTMCTVDVVADSLGVLASFPQVRSISAGQTQRINDPRPAVGQIAVPGSESHQQLK